MDAENVPGIFVGYDKNSPAYLIYFQKNSMIKKYIKFTNTLKNDGYKINNSVLMSEEVEMSWARLIQRHSLGRDSNA